MMQGAVTRRVYKESNVAANQNVMGGANATALVWLAPLCNCRCEAETHCKGDYYIPESQLRYMKEILYSD